MLILAGFADRLILHPSTALIPVINGQRVEVPSASGALEIWAIRTSTARTIAPKAFVLAFIGNASRAEYECPLTADEWSQLPVEVWTVNYPGFGGSAGAAKLKFIPPAALAAYDAMAKTAAGRPIFVSGNSIGTTAALHVAANRAVAGMVLRNPPPLRQLIVGHYGWWNLWLAAGPIAAQIPSELDSIANAKKVTAPAIFLLSQNDTIIPPQFQQRVVSAYAGPKRLIHLPNADHNDPLEPPTFTQLRGELQWLYSTASDRPK